MEDACLRRPGPGANGRKRVALYTQLHHAAVDGQAAVALANALLDVTPEPRDSEVKPSKRTRVFKLEMAEMLRGVLGSQAQKVASIVRALPATVGTLKNAATAAVSASELLTGRMGSGKLTLAPRTPLKRVGDHGPGVHVVPVASPGGAARDIAERIARGQRPELEDIDYARLFHASFGTAVLRAGSSAGPAGAG